MITKKITNWKLFFIVVIGCLIITGLSISIVQAQAELTETVPEKPEPSEIVPPVLSVSIPGFGKFSEVTCSDPDTPCQIPWLGEYIKAIYNYSLIIVAILAIIIMMIGGVIWLTAGGNRERIGEAMKFIKGGVLGVVLMVCSYTLLFIMNPNLVILSPIEISYIEERDMYDLSPEEQISAQEISGPIGNNVFGEGTNGVPLIMQCQAPVSSIPYGAKNNRTKCGSKICSSGCGVASLGMVLFYFKKENDFNNVVDRIYQNGGRNECKNGTANYSLGTTAEQYGLKIDRDGSGFDWVSEKAKKCPVIISVWEKSGACPFTNARHFIVVTGSSGGVLSINDPMHGGTTISLNDMKQKCTFGTGATQICNK